MFRFFRQTLLGSVFVISIIGLAFYFILSSSDTPSTSEESDEERVVFRQDRLFVTKELLYSNPEGERMEMKMVGKKASLEIEKVEKSYEVKEYAADVKGFFCGEKQKFDSFEAGRAEYDNTTGLFFMTDVKVFKTTLSPFKFGRQRVEGSCDEARFSLLDKKINLSAKGFHAHFQGKEKT